MASGGGLARNRCTNKKQDDNDVLTFERYAERTLFGSSINEHSMRIVVEVVMSTFAATVISFSGVPFPLPSSAPSLLRPQEQRKGDMHLRRIRDLEALLEAAAGPAGPEVSPGPHRFRSHVSSHCHCPRLAKDPRTAILRSNTRASYRSGHSCLPRTIPSPGAQSLLRKVTNGTQASTESIGRSMPCSVCPASSSITTTQHVPRWFGIGL